MLNYIWLIPILPAISSLINGIFGKKFFSKKIIHILACGTVFISFLIALICFFQLSQKSPEERTYEIKLYDWILGGESLIRDGSIANLNISFSFLYDPLSAVMVLVVCGVGFLIHIYSIGYMYHEGGYYRYFSFLNLFMTSMLILVLGANFLVMFIGWEGVGLCSYLLIGFYFGRDSAASAGKKAFIVNRVGDFGFILAICAIFYNLGTLDFLKAFPLIFSNYQSGDITITVIALALLLGATGKSAQIPLYVWLPDAMEGPTPVSALIHAATMVTAGVYMIARCNIIFSLSPIASLAVALIGAITAFYAATIGLAQYDIKRVLAYSTISQIGYMILATGVGAYAAGIAHLVTHAFFKALLFMGAGSVIHALSGIQDMRNMGGLKKKLPITFWTFLTATLAIAGIPPLSGFFTKDEILWKSFSSPFFYDTNWNIILWLLGFAGAGLTAFYMFRLIFLTFYGNPRYDEKTAAHLHESPEIMLIPLRILAILSIIGGVISVPKFLQIGPLSSLDNLSLEKFLHSVIYAKNNDISFTANIHHLEPILMISSIAIALVGISTAYIFYIKIPTLPEILSNKFKKAYKLIFNKYYIDEIYNILFVQSTKALGDFLAKFDLAIIDGLVNLTAAITIRISSTSVRADLNIVDGAVNGLAQSLKFFSKNLRKIQTGLVQNYLLIMLYTSFFIFAIYLILSW